MSPKLTESHVERSIVDFLSLDGWICRKTEENYSERKRKRTGESGMPDRQCVRYGIGVACEMFWLELKSRKGKTAAHQKAWHAAERARGALVVVAHQDFEPSIEGFAAWYRQSGLQRNMSLKIGAK